MRTMLIGALTPAIPATPGIRWPVRRITRPPTRSRSSALGLPDVGAVGRRDRRRLQPEARGTHRVGRLGDHRVRGLAAMFEREVECLQLELHVDDVRVDHPERLVEQLLAGLVATQDDDGGHRQSVRRHLDAATGRRDAIIAACRTR